MDERELLLLGLLTSQSQHGYQITEFIERNLGRMTNLKKATAYVLLERLGRQGLVSVHVEQEGNRPPRKVYTITAHGAEVFREALREHLAHAERLTLSGDISLMFLDHLPREEQLRCLRLRQHALEGLIATYEQMPQHGAGIGVDLTIERNLLHLRTDRGWLEEVIQRLEQPRS